MARPETTPALQAGTAIADALADAGTELLFGVPGGGANLDLIGACEERGIRFVLTRTETAAALMAATAGELTGRPGACVATRGPGAASIVNGVAHALLDRAPMVVVTDAVPPGEANRISHQRLDQRAMFEPVAKASLAIGGSDPGDTARAAVELALAPPWGPVHLDYAPGAEPGRLPPPRLTAASDLDELLAVLRGRRRPVVLAGLGVRFREDVLRAAVARLSERADGLSPSAVVECARRMLDDTVTATVDAGAHMLVAVPLWTVSEPRRLLISNGLSTMGFALPAAIAATQAGSSPAVCFTGDGGLGMCLAELETLARLQAPVTVIVFNDGRLSLIEIKQGPGQGGTAAVRMGATDHACVASGFGIESARVDDAGSLASALRSANDARAPYLIDVAVDPSPYPNALRTLRG
jgi:thiamine pyrophosphate-dependent acetolactate synthase large subunit-like protein